MRRTDDAAPGSPQHPQHDRPRVLSLLFLTLAETALALGIEESAAAKRYVRALKRLKAILATMPGGLDNV